MPVCKLLESQMMESAFVGHPMTAQNVDERTNAVIGVALMEGRSIELIQLTDSLYGQVLSGKEIICTQPVTKIWNVHCE